MPISTPKQKKARERNWLKAQLTSAKAVLTSHRTSSTMTVAEQWKAGQAVAYLEDILNNWDTSSKQLGFNVRDKKKEIENE